MESNKGFLEDYYNTLEFIDSFKKMAQAVHLNAKEHGWWDGAENQGYAPDLRNSAECIALIHSELSEALEGLRKPHTDEHCPAFRSVEIEMADAVIRIMDLCEARGWRIAEAISAKHEFNKSREYKHGKRF